MKRLNSLQKWGVALICVGVIICVVGFFLPPMGDIPVTDIEFFGEVLVAVGLLMAWDIIHKAIDKGTDATVKVGDKVEVHIDSSEDGRENV